MLHVRVSTPVELTDQVVHVFIRDPAVSSLAVLRGSSLMPPGDIVLADVARATDMLCRELPSALRGHGIDVVVADQTEPAGALDAALEWYARDERDLGTGQEGGAEMPYPPDYPKMPGEPPRVQPSRKNEANWS